MHTFSLMIAATLLGIGCGGPTNLTPDASKEVVNNIPAWFLEPPDESNYLYAATTMTSKDLQVSVQKATTAARVELAQQYGTRVQDLKKQLQSEVGVDEASEFIQDFDAAAKIVTDQTLTGARVDKKEIQRENGIFRAYVRMRLPLGKANELLLDEIKKNEGLDIELRKTKLFQELQKATAK